MKQLVIVSALLLLMALCMPLLFPKGSGMEAPPQTQTEPDESSQDNDTQDNDNTTYADERILFTSVTDDVITQYTAAEYLPYVLAGEMPAAFEFEALKAQAVAARTYILYCAGHENAAHPGADVCTDSTCCKGYANQAELREKWGAEYDGYWEKICAAVSQTDGEYLVWENQAIQAVFHSSSAGITEDSGNIWSGVPYLLSVDSPETEEMVPNFVTTFQLAAEEFADKLSAAYPEAVFSGTPEDWIGDISYNSSGRVDSAAIAGVEVSGTAIREIFSLRSAAFTLEYTQEAGFVFTVTGYGHGVGLSQYGANIMAKSGVDYKQILRHYYTGVEFAVYQ